MMKKLMTIAMGIVAAMASAAEWTEAQINEARAKLAQGTLPAVQLCQLEKSIEILGGTTPASFEEIVSRCAPIERKYNPAITDERIAYFALNYACWRFNGKFVQEGYAYAVQLQCSVFIYRFAANHQAALKLTDEQAYQQLMACLMDTGKKCLLPEDYIPCLEAAMQRADVIDDATVLANLKKLNRIYTAKLIKDKAKWEPLVISIRTYLDTYR